MALKRIYDNWQQLRAASGTPGSRQRREWRAYLQERPLIAYWGVSWFSTPLYRNLCWNSFARIDGMSIRLGGPGLTAPRMLTPAACRDNAERFAARGFDLLVTADDADLTLAADGLAQHGTAVRAVQADLTTPDGVAAVLDAVTGTGRPLDVAVLNAGRGDGGPFLEIPLENDLATVELNVVATLRLAKGLLPAMVQRGAGRVLVTSSVGGLMPGPYYATYAASKAFLTSFTEAVRHELKDTGVTLTALLPGPTDTGFF